MKQRRKKVLSLLLAAACSLSLGSQGAAAFQQQEDTITDGSELSQMVRDHWEEDYFDQVVIDPKRETVTADGEKTTLEQSLGLRDTEAEQVMDSAQAAQDYFRDTPYEAEQTEQGTVIVTAPYQTKRLVVSTPALSTTCGAEEVLYDAQTRQHYLQYATQEDAQAAYETLSDRYGTDRCFVDQILDAEAVLQTAGEGQTSYSWGASYMGMDVLKEAVEDSDMTATATVAVVDTGVDARPRPDGRHRTRHPRGRHRGRLHPGQRAAAHPAHLQPQRPLQRHLDGSSHPLCRAAAGVGHQHQRWMGQRHCQCLRPRHPGPGHFGGA